MTTTAYIIEDDAITGRMLKRIVECSKTGFSTVRHFLDAEEALPVIFQMPPRLMLVDVCLPGLSGLELTREVKGHRPETKIIVITGCSEERTFWESAKAGADGFLAKPFNASVLVHALGKVTKGDGPPLYAPFLFQRPPAPRGSFLLPAISDESGVHAVCSLSGRETEVMSLVDIGLSDKEIAVQLNLSENTVGGYLKRIFIKLGVHSRCAAIQRWRNTQAIPRLGNEGVHGQQL